MTREPSLTEVLLTTAAEAETGAVETVRQRLESLVPRLQARHRQFRLDAVGNPETEEHTVSAALVAFAGCEQALEQMTTAAVSNDSTGVQAAGAALQTAATALRTQQEAYAAGIEALGPTPFPAINRVIFHARCLKDGMADTRYTLTALQDLMSFEADTDEDLAARERRCIFSDARPQARAAAAEVGGVVRSAAELLQSAWPGLSPSDKRQITEELERRLVDAADRLAQALTRYAAAEAASGPTQNPTVNVILKAANNLDSGAASSEDFAGLLSHIQDNTEAGSPLFELLDGLRIAVMTGNHEDAAALLPELYRLGNAPIGGRQAEEDDEIVFDFVYESDGVRAPRQAPVTFLPSNLQAALDAAEAYLAQPASGPQAAFGVIDGLRKRTETTRAGLKKQTLAPGMEGPMMAGLARLEEALDSLRLAVESRNPHALEAARGLLAQAGEILAAVATTPR